MKPVVPTKMPRRVIDGESKASVGKGRELTPSLEAILAAIDLRAHYVGPVLEAILRLAH